MSSFCGNLWHSDGNFPEGQVRFETNLKRTLNKIQKVHGCQMAHIAVKVYISIVAIEKAFLQFLKANFCWVVKLTLFSIFQVFTLDHLLVNNTVVVSARVYVNLIIYYCYLFECVNDAIQISQILLPYEREHSRYERPSQTSRLSICN